MADAVERVCDAGSRYWLHLRRGDLDPGASYEVEARIDFTPGSFDECDLPTGWRLAHLEPTRGMLFIRRRQRLTDDEVREMFRELVTFAYRTGGKFHSWMHEPELKNW